MPRLQAVVRALALLPQDCISCFSITLLNGPHLATQAKVNNEAEIARVAKSYTRTTACKQVFR